MIRRPPRSTRTDTLFPSRRSSDLQGERPHGGGKPPLTSFRGCQRDTVRACRGMLCQSSPVQSSCLPRSEEHTSELQSLMRISYAVFCLKKKTITHNKYTQTYTTEQEQHKHT